MSLFMVPDPPPPSDAANMLRWAHTAKRWRMLYGYWQQDADREMTERLGAVKAAAWKKADMSANPFKAISQQVSVLYDQPAVWSHPSDAAALVDGGGAEAEPQPSTASADLAAILDNAGWAPLMQRAQRDCEGMREMLIRADWVTDGLVLRPVWPHYVEAFASPSCPDLPVRVREARYRTAERRWVWDDIDVSDPSAPRYVTTDAAGLTIEEHPWPAAWRDSTAAAILPIVLYHAARTGMLWDAFEGLELVEGTTSVALQWSMFAHSLLRASWPQRWAIGVDIAGADAQGAAHTARQSVTADPATVLILAKQADFDGQPTVGQWSPGSDPDKIASAVAQYEERLVTYAGLSPSDFARTSGDPRSGYALAISSEGQLKASRRRAPNYRRGDVAMARIVSCMSNRMTGTTLPEMGWSVEYPAVAPPASESDPRE